MDDDYSKWFVRSRGGRLISKTSSGTKEEALSRFLSGKRYPVWGPWYESGYRLVKVTLSIPVTSG